MVRLRFISLALGSTFLIKSPWISALFWLAIIRDIRFPIFAIIGLVVADAVAWALGTGEKVKRAGALRSNAIFASIAVAWLTTASGRSLEVQLAIEVSAAIAASLMAAAFVRALRDTILPPLGWGFYIVAGVLFTLFSTWTQSALQATVIWPRPHDALGWIESFFRSLGMLLFLPKIEVGILVAIAILLWSRLMLLTGIVGWICGVGLGLVLEHMGLTYLWLLAAHNYFLAAMLLGSVLFLPGRATSVIAAIAGISASVLSAYFQYLFPASAFAFLPVPAALTVWLGIGALLLRDEAGYFRRNMASDLPPEVAWWNSAYWRERFGEHEPFFAVPIAGPVQITQGFDGQLSHVGRWRYALDFQRQGPLAGGPSAASIWEAPVYAPAPGIVEAMRADIPDNPLGITNFAEMWGNYIVIRLDAGGWAMLAHLRQGSAAVFNGGRVETGTYLGQVGNSGRSPIPHLHLHAQVSHELSATTMPFRLANFMSGSAPSPAPDFMRWNATGVPPVGSIVMAAQANPRAHEVVTSLAPGTAVWQIESEGRIPREFRRHDLNSVVRVRIFLDEAGRHLFKSFGDGTLVTSMGPDAWRLLEMRDVDCPLLKLLAVGAPSVPYAAFKGMTWLEPTPLLPHGPSAWLKLLALPYLKHPFSSLSCTCTSAPDDANKFLTIETKPNSPHDGTPVKVVCQMERLRGPVRVEAFFETGKLCFSIFSFEPGLPFERREKSRG
jgi:hypothetical protein